jgi:hypothetical protein
MLSDEEFEKLLARCNRHLDKIESGEILLIKNPNYHGDQEDSKGLESSAIRVSKKSKGKKKKG